MCFDQLGFEDYYKNTNRYVKGLQYPIQRKATL